MAVASIAKGNALERPVQRRQGFEGFGELIELPMTKERRRNQQKTPHILRHEPEEPKLPQLREKINPSKRYTLTEAAALTDMNRSIWSHLVRPTTDLKRIRVPSTITGRKRVISGSDILAFMESISEMPKKTVDLEQVAVLLERSYAGVKSALIWHENEGHLSYTRKCDGEYILIRLHKDIRTERWTIDERSYRHLEQDVEKGKTLMNWEQAEEYLKEKGIDLEYAQLKISNKRKKVILDDRDYLQYLSPSGLQTLVPIITLPKKGAMVFRKDLDALAEVVLTDQKLFIPYPCFLKELGLTGNNINNHGLKGRGFSVDCEQYRMVFYKKGGVQYLRRNTADAYARWRDIYFNRGTEYLALKKHACRAFTSEQTDDNYKKILERAIKVDGEIIVQLVGIYGLGIRIYEIDGVYYARREYDEILSFFLNATHLDSRARAKAIHDLENEIEETKKPDMLLSFKLWITRGIFLRHWGMEPKSARSAISHFDRVLIKNDRAGVFKRYSLEKIEEVLGQKTTDLRYVAAKNRSVETPENMIDFLGS